MTIVKTRRINKVAALTTAVALAVGGAVTGVALSASAQADNIRFTDNPGTTAFAHFGLGPAVEFSGLADSEDFTVNFSIDEAGGAVDFQPVGMGLLGTADGTGNGIASFPMGLVDVEHGDTIRTVVTPDTSGGATYDYVVFSDIGVDRRDGLFISTPATSGDLLLGLEYTLTNLPPSTTADVAVGVDSGSGIVWGADTPLTSGLNGRATIDVIAGRDGNTTQLLEGDSLAIRWGTFEVVYPVGAEMSGNVVVQSNLSGGGPNISRDISAAGLAFHTNSDAISIAGLGFANGANLNIVNLNPGESVTVEIETLNSDDEPYPNFFYQNGFVVDNRGVIEISGVDILRDAGENLQVGDTIVVTIQTDDDTYSFDPVVVTLGSESIPGGVFFPAEPPVSTVSGDLAVENPLPFQLAAGVDFNFRNLASLTEFGYQVVVADVPITVDDAAGFVLATSNEDGTATINYQALLGGEELDPGMFYGLIYHHLLSGESYLMFSAQLPSDGGGDGGDGGDGGTGGTVTASFPDIGTAPTAENFLAGLNYRIEGLEPSAAYSLQVIGSMSPITGGDVSEASAFNSDSEGVYTTVVTLGLGLVTPTDPLEPGTYWAIYLFDSEGVETLLTDGRIPVENGGGGDGGDGGTGSDEPIGSFVLGNPTGAELAAEGGVEVLLSNLDVTRTYTVELFGTLPDETTRVVLSTTTINPGEAVDGEYLLTVRGYLEDLEGTQSPLPDGTLLEIVLTDDLDVQLTVLSLTLGAADGETPIGGESGDGDAELAKTGENDEAIQLGLVGLVGGSFLVAAGLGAAIFIRRRNSLEAVTVEN